MIIHEQFTALLESTAMAHIATIGPHGEPHSTPVWFHWDGTHLRFPQTRTRQKVRNLARDPRIAVSIADPANPYRSLEIRGVVTQVEDDRDLAFHNALAKKYLGQDTFPWNQPTDERVVVVVEPQHTTSFGY